MRIRQRAPGNLRGTTDSAKADDAGKPPPQRSTRPLSDRNSAIPNVKIGRIDWSKQSIRSLEELWVRGQSGQRLSDSEYLLMSRYGEILTLLARNAIWPPTASPERTKFRAALREALCRLPQDAFDRVDGGLRFLLDDPSLKMLAVNAPAPSIPRLPGDSKVGAIIFFRACMELAPKALVGLIAHEIAHSFVCGNDSLENEILANKQARNWGFGSELDCLEKEKKRLFLEACESSRTARKTARRNGSALDNHFKTAPERSTGPVIHTLFQTAPAPNGFKPASIRSKPKI